jgi:dihydroxy-acid dehydratase
MDFEEPYAFVRTTAGMQAVLAGEVVKGDVVIVRYEGPVGGPGMQEMLALTGALQGRGLGQ